MASSVIKRSQTHIILDNGDTTYIKCNFTAFLLVGYASGEGKYAVYKLPASSEAELILGNATPSISIENESYGWHKITNNVGWRLAFYILAV